MENELSNRKETINDKIIIIQNKIREFIDNNTDIKNEVKSQVNPKLKKFITGNKKSIDKMNTEIINKYSKLYEKYLSTFKRIFEADQKYIPLYYENLLNELNNDLTNLSEKNLKNFNHENRNLIKSQSQNSEEGQDIALKGYIRRNNILLENIKSFINLLITLVKKIQNLANELTKNLKIIDGHSQNQNDTIKETFIDPYRNISELFEEIKDIFSKIEGNESKGKKLTLIMDKKLINIQNKLKNKDIGINEIKKVNDDYSKLIKKILELDKIFKDGYNAIKKDENIIRIDILFIFDITSSMEEYLNRFKNKIKNIIKEISNRCPIALIYVGFIGYRDLNDIDLGDEYIDIDFTINYDKLENEIKKIEADGGDDIPEDVAGAFKMALKKEWRGDTRIALLITDSPCHGGEFHNSNGVKDKYPSEQNIKNMIHQFKKENISLICFKLTKNTDKMFEIFKNEYNSEEEKNHSLFTINNDFFECSFIQTIEDLFDNNFKSLVGKEKKKKASEKNFK